MDFNLDLVWWAIAALAVLGGLLGIFLPLLPGMPLLFAGLWLAAGLDDYARVEVVTVVLLGGMAVLGWLADYLAAVVGVRQAGASGKAMAGAGIGAALGVFGGLPGLILGPIVGAMAGEARAGADPRQVTRAGIAAGFGFLLATIFKLLLAFAMLGVFAVAYWW
jgi:uncharacterized protein YqgC (DUF456 family)